MRIRREEGTLNSAPTHELQRNVFPSSDIINRVFVYLGKLCDAKTPRLIAYGGFRPRTTQARTRREQILNIGIHIDRRPIRRTSRDGIATSLGTPEEREDSASPSEPHTRNAPCRASSLTPISMSTSKSVRAALPSARAADRSERSNRFLPHRFGMTSSRAPNERSPRALYIRNISFCYISMRHQKRKRCIERWREQAHPECRVQRCLEKPPLSHRGYGRDASARSRVRIRHLWAPAEAQKWRTRTRERRGPTRAGRRRAGGVPAAQGPWDTAERTPEGAGWQIGVLRAHARCRAPQDGARAGAPRARRHRVHRSPGGET